MAENSQTQRDGFRESLGDARRALTRDRFIEAALSIFHDQGYANATIEDVVALAGAGRTTYYLHFKNKADLITAVMERELPEAQAHYRALDQLGEPTRADIDAWLLQTIDYWRKKGWIIDIINQAIAVEPSLAGRYAALLNETIDVMTNYFGRWHTEPEEARIRAAAMTLQLERVCYVWLVRGVSFDERRMLKILGDMWEYMMRT
jgi:AcrR family transcriptional regulator